MTLVALILLFACIATIFLESKVYAASEKSNNTAGCDCIEKHCPQASDQPPSNENNPDCAASRARCYCNRAKFFFDCPRSSCLCCAGTITSGCDAGSPCDENNCYNTSTGCDNNGNGCPNNTCGNCEIYGLNTDPVYSKCFSSAPYCSYTYMGCMYKLTGETMEYIP